MNGWKVVPVEPTEAMTTEIEHSARMGAIWTAASAYTAMLAAAPTPPVVLPPPPQSFTILSRLQSGTEEVVRLDEAIAYARAALAAYGIVDRQEDAA